MKKVLLIYVIGENAILRYEDIGMCMIASVINKRGNPMQLVTFRYPNVNWEEIQTYNPDIIGFTVYSNTVECISTIINKIHEMLPDVKFIVGGPHAAFNGEAILKTNEHINYVVRGEGEKTIIELLDMLDLNIDVPHTIDGIIYKDINNKICSTKDREPIKDLDTLPFAERNLMLKNHPIASVSTSRGCYANCSFCARISYYKKWRGRSPKNVVDEIEKIKIEHKVEAYGFIDGSFEDSDDFGNPLARLMKIANELIDRELNISYFAYFRARFHKHATDDIMQLLVKSGLCVSTIGIESCNTEDLKLYNKPATPEDNHKAMQLFQEYDIGVLPGFINFNPYSTMEKIRLNFDFLQKYNLCYRFWGKLIAYENTKIQERIKNDNLITAYDKGGFSYNFVDKTVQKYYDYIQHFITKSNTYNNAFSKYVEFADKHLLLLHYSKRKIKLDEAVRAFAALEEVSENLKNAFIKTDRFIAQWLCESLNTKDNNFHSIKIDYDEFSRLVEEMEKYRVKLYFVLAKHGYGHLVHESILM